MDQKKRKKSASRRFRMLAPLFRGNPLYVLVMIFLMLILGPLLEDTTHIRIFFDLFMSAVFISGTYALSQQKKHILVAGLLALPMLISIWSRYFFISSAMILAGRICGVAFFGFLIFQILTFIASRQEVTRDLIISAAVVYLLLAVTWAFLYAIVERLVPGSFAIAAGKQMTGFAALMYFSLVTLTTLGYGDITPVTRLAGALATTEAVVGQLYLVVQVAWLVGMYVSKRSR